jgi:hypothetical protein
MTGIGTSYCGYLPLTSAQIQFTRLANTLQSASLNVTGAVLQDCSGITSVTATADISLTWTGSGPNYPSRYNSTGRDSGPYGADIFHVHSAGIERLASATGSLIVNGTDVLAGVTSDSEFASLMKSTYVQLDITKSF